MRAAVAFVSLGVLDLLGCSTSIRLQNYATDCDADIQCVRISVGDVCSCDCNLGAINDRDYDKYLNDLQNIGACHTVCTAPDGGPNNCGAGVGARCAGSQCETYTLPDAAPE